MADDGEKEGAIPTNLRLLLVLEAMAEAGVPVTVHVGIGTSANLGGAVSAKTHFDAICRSPTVQIDEKVVLEDGKIVI